MEIQESTLQQFRQTLGKIEHLYHVKEFKSFSQTKINHLKQEKRFHPADYFLQARRMLLHLIYLYYIAYVKKIDFYLYPNICINRWGVIFSYYSLRSEHQTFMKKVDYTDFKDGVGQEFRKVWNIINAKQDPTEVMNPWIQFQNSLVESLQSQTDTPKDIITKLEQTNYMKNNVFILGVLSSTIFPCVKLKTSLEKAFYQSYKEQHEIVNKIFKEGYENEGTTQLVNSIVGFFKVLNDSRILGITTTHSEKSSPITAKNQSLLTQFLLNLGRPLVPKETSPQKMDNLQEKAEIPDKSDKQESSNQSSEHDYNQGSEEKDLGQLKCQFLWSKRNSTRELNFRVSVFINKKIYPLYFNEIQKIWYQLSDKWKVILNENKQLSGFNPGFIILDYNKDSYQISFTDQVKYQPNQHILSELILATDKLIIASLALRDVICYYEKKSLTVQILEHELAINDGRLEDMAISVCQSIKNYYTYCKKVNNSVQCL